MKKIALMTLVVMLAISAFFYIQLNKLESAVSTKLAQHETTFHAFNLGILPQPYISFDKVQYNRISIEKLTGKFPLSAMLFGDVKLQEIDIQNLKLSENAQNAATIQMRFSDFSLGNITTDNISLSGDSQILVELAKPLYGNNRVFNFHFMKGGVQRSEERKLVAYFDHVVLNEEKVGFVKTTLDLSQYTKHLTADIDSYCTTRSPCLAHLDYASDPDQSAVSFRGKNYPIERLLALFNFPNTLTGNTDFDITAEFVQSRIKAGKFYFSAHDGELSGVNLLELAGQYLPINWQNAEVKQKDAIKTPYKKFVMSSMLQENQLKIDKILLKTTALSGEGSGQVNLKSMQCDVNLTLRANNEKYSEFVLPLRFFNNCYSPQYEVLFDKNLRNQLKDLLKRKLGRE